MKNRKVSNDKPLIFTRDKQSAEELISLGYELISKTSDGWTFVNSTDGKFDGSKPPVRKAAATNRMFF